MPATAERRGQRAHERALSDARRTREPDAVSVWTSAPEGSQQRGDARARLRAAVLDEVEGAGDGDALASANAGRDGRGQRVELLLRLGGLS